MISEEKCNNDKISFQMCEGHSKSVNQRIRKVLLHIKFVTFSFMGTLES